jgi:hypothetical protein
MPHQSFLKEAAGALQLFIPLTQTRYSNIYSTHNLFSQAVEKKYSL